MECLQCGIQFQQSLLHSGKPSYRHVYCGVSCWQKAGGHYLHDVSDLGTRHCIYCHGPFIPNTRLQRYCNYKCFELAREPALQNWLPIYIDDVGRDTATKENCRAAAIRQGFTGIMLDWLWAEYTYASKDDRLRLEDLPC
jgi:hypothetical protein